MNAKLSTTQPMTKPVLEKLFSEETIKKAIVPWWKYWLLPLIKPLVWRQAKWTFIDENGKKHKVRGLLKW